MIQLYTAECRRFARWGLGVVALHLLALLMLDRFLPGLRNFGEIYIIVGCVYGLAGAILGVYQAASYARINHWIALLHRPLAPWRIMLAISSAGATIVIAAILIPTLVFTAWLTAQPGNVVDIRHWILPLAGACVGLVGFILGNYVAVAPRRYGWTAIVTVLILIAGENAAGARALLLFAMIVAILGLALAGAFKPERTDPPSNPALLAITAAVTAFGLYFVLLVGGAFAYQMTLVAAGRNPLINVPTPGGLVETSRADSGELIATALPEAPALGAAVRKAKPIRLPNVVDSLPISGELISAMPARLVDQRRGVEWTFSHDANAFVGLRLKDRRPAGVLKPERAFDAPPLPTGDDRMIAGGTLYRFDPARGAIDSQFTLPAGEVIVARPVQVGTVIAILGDRALYLVAQSDGKSRRVPVAGAIGDIRRIDLAPLPDRMLISFFFGRNAIEGPARAWQHVVAVAPDGAVSTVARRSFAPEFSDAVRYRIYWLSPATHLIAEAVTRMGGNAAPYLRSEPIAVPGSIRLASVFLSLIAAVGTVLLARRRRLRPVPTACWVAATLLFGLPVLGTFLLMGRRRAA
ncbi:MULTISPECIES: hypothetical protein [unclassified Sphingomonas]|uniref:hypothetical protein n=1 Tax=unclassified Sphingomonas TaxID=196159 RepID=UPI00215075C0|nr:MULTISPECIES: hypothetical protein [unclassified Sphingomonas]MCR5869462.1 hypothetical protein [Sphingomonas sp. J344]UUX98808.1 hypothetical protein LRS08_14980 [Sphingomonas sp. J315]